MATGALQPSAASGGQIACEYSELHGANIYSPESVLVVRIVASSSADRVVWTLERPSAVLDKSAGLLEALGLSAVEVRARERWPLGSLLKTIAEQLAERAGMPIGAPAVAAPADPERELVLSLASAALMRASCELAVRLVFSANEVPAHNRERLQTLLEDFDQRHPALWPRAAALVAACRRREIPWRRIPGWADYVQLGEGALQVRTNTVGSLARTAVELASDKTASSRLLGRHGIPVAPHIASTNPARAWETAKRIGLPVVVKPRWMDKGTAVSVGLTTQTEVEEAFQRAAKVGRWVLIERLIPGEDHRVLVAGGRFIAAVRRMPAAVVADGTRTIDELLARANADPRRTAEKTTPLNPIRYDEDSERMLRVQGWSLDSVPPAGARVRLKSAASWGIGGSLRDVTDAIHPDNVELCVRAIVLCGIDVGGADLLTTDISRSFHEVGGALCEVNVLPGLAVHLFAEGKGDRDVMGAILDALYPDVPRWRVPTVVVCGEDADAVGRGVVAALHDARWTVGYAGPSQTSVGGWVVARERQPLHLAHSLLIEDPSTQVVVVAMTPARVLAEGVGVARADVVALTDRDPPAADVRDVLASTRARVLLSRDAAFVAEQLTRSCPRPRA